MTGIRPEIAPPIAPADITQQLSAEEFIVRRGVPPGSQAEMRRRRALRLVQNLPEGLDFGALESGLAKLGDVPGVSDSLFLSEVVSVGKELRALQRGRAATGTVLAASSQFLRSLSFGALPDPVEEGKAAVGKLVGEVLGLAMLGVGTYKALGRFSQLPRIEPIMQQVPSRVRSFIKGGVAFGIAEAARPEGIPEEPAALDLPGRLAKFLEPSLGARTALGVAGFAVGGSIDMVIGESLRAVSRGVRTVREVTVARQLPDEALNDIRTALRSAGVQLEAGESKRALVRKLLANQDKIAMNVITAAGVADGTSRAGYVAQFLFDNPQFAPAAATRGASVSTVAQEGEDALYIAGLFSSAPEGVSVARGITDPRAIDKAARLLNVSLIGVKSGDNVLVVRPRHDLPEIGKLGQAVQKQIARFRSLVRSQNRSQTGQQPIVNIMVDGKTVVGGFDAADAARQFKFAAPVVAGVERPDIAVRNGLGILQLELQETSTAIVRLPGGVTRPQMRQLIRQIEQAVPEQVVIETPGVARPNIVLNRPFGIQVEDAIVQAMPKVRKPRVTAEMQNQVRQFAREGVFKGQAGILGNGYAVRVLKKFKDGTLKVEDAFTREKVTVHEDQISLLPHSLEGSLAPNQFVFTALNPEEQALYRKLLHNVTQGFGEPIKSYAELERLAASRGLFLTKLEKGKIRVFDPDTGESLVVEDLRAGAAAVRRMVGPLPDVTPPEVAELLGGRTNLGIGGVGAAPPRFGERLPIGPDGFDPEDVRRMVEEFGPIGAVHKFITPTRGLLLDVERRYNIPVGKAFLAIQEQLAHRQNFMSAWLTGDAPGLPKGVLPLMRIQRLAGPKANQELITEWLESSVDEAARKAVEARMTKAEIRAAGELRKWYDGLFEAFGVEQPYLFDYAPHIRAWAPKLGNDVRHLWQQTRRGPLPKAVDAIADYARSGVMDIYETRAFAAASQYASSMSNNRYMAGVLDEARELLWEIPDNGLKAPLASYIEAIRGTEFAEQNRALTASIDRMLEGVGITHKARSAVADSLMLNLLGMSYAATMAFRPGLALRNITQLLHTTWTMFGGIDDTLAEGIGRALTRFGRDQAMIDGAIVAKTGGIFAAEEIAQAQPRVLRELSNVGMRLYSGADEWNRAVSYWTARIRAEKALNRFAEKTAGASPQVLKTARRQLIKDSGTFVMDKPVIDEFLRRATQSPERAARYLGFNAANVTQWLYGRGNQTWWMRTVPGRLVGQYGTWPLWYLDFLRRTTRNMVSNGFGFEAVKFLGRVGIANAAFLGAIPAATGIALGKWSAVQSLFYTGGPGLEALGGIATLQRGIGATLGDPDDPFAQSRISEGSRILERTVRAFIPGFYAARDIDRLVNARDFRSAAAAALSARLTADATIQEQIDLLMNPGRLSTDIEIEDRMPGLTAAEIADRALRLGPRRSTVPQTGVAVPQRQTGQGQAGQQGGGQQPTTVPPQPLPGAGVQLPQPTPAPGESLPAGAGPQRF